MENEINIDGVIYVKKEGANNFTEKPGAETQTGLTPKPTMKPQPAAAAKEYPIICSQCGQEATVPFEPKEGWSALCRACYAKNKEAKANA